MRIKKIHVQKLWRLCYNWCRILHRDTNKLFYVLLRLKAREKRMKKRRKRVSMKKGKMMVTALMVMTHRML